MVDLEEEKEEVEESEKERVSVGVYGERGGVKGMEDVERARMRRLGVEGGVESSRES